MTNDNTATNRPITLCSVAALFFLLATLHTWPMLTDPAHLTRLDNNDTAFNTWVVAWVARALATEPLGLFAAPIFHPAPDALAFSEHMVVQGIIGAPLQWIGISPVAVYNILVWLGLALSGLAMALLLRAWTGSTLAGIVAGCLYAFNAHLLTRYSHLQALHIEFFPVALYAFDRVLRGAGPRTIAVLAVMFTVQALCSNYTMVMTAVALLAALAVRAEPWRRGSGRVWVSLFVAGVVVVLLLLPFLLPYYRVRGEQGMARTIDEVRFYSATWQDYFFTAGRLHYAWWSHRITDSRATLFPGVVGLALAALALFSGVAWRDPRARMALAFGTVGFALSFGAALPGYAWLQENVPMFQGIRAAARWGFLALVAISILAAFTVAQLQARWQRYRWWPALAFAIVGLITVEALRAPLSMHRFDGIPDVHQRLASDEVRAIVVFPLFGGAQFHHNAPYLLHQTRHWKPMINAYSSFAPETFYQRADRLQTFPAPEALDELRSIGVSHIVLHRAPLERDYGRAAVDALRSHPELELVLEQDGVIFYRLRRG